MMINALFTGVKGKEREEKRRKKTEEFISLPNLKIKSLARANSCRVVRLNLKASS
jgi:hypothetical protein